MFWSGRDHGHRREISLPTLANPRRSQSPLFWQWLLNLCPRTSASLVSEAHNKRVMRRNLIKRSSTKQERIVHEVLKELHVPFRHRWIVEGREVDFLLFDTICLEINGHEQDTLKNEILSAKGYTPIHLHNDEVSKETVRHLILKFT